MPFYDYECEDCGVFTEQRSMDLAALPCDCPDCGAASPRAFLVMPALFGMDAGKRRALATNEESRHRPKTGEEYSASNARRHPSGCGCCSPKAKRGLQRPDGAKTFPAARPWMISH
jgi:putative FmdB family regulatory protein